MSSGLQLDLIHYSFIPQKRVLLVTPLFNSWVDFKFFVSNIIFMVAKCYNFNLKKKSVIGSTTFQLEG